jgi:hypothetical protein
MIKLNLGISLIAAILVSSSSFSQTALNVHAGLNFSTMSISDNDQSFNDGLSTLAGYQFGTTIEFSLGNLISLETGLKLATRGYNYYELRTDSFGAAVWTTETTADLKALYIDLPVRMNFNIGIGENSSLKIGVGPYAAFGIQASEHAIEVITNEHETATDSDENTDAFMYRNRLDYGLTAQVGFKYKSVLVQANYDFGLRNMDWNPSNGFKALHRVFGISLGYQFGLGKK